MLLIWILDKLYIIRVQIFRHLKFWLQFCLHLCSKLSAPVFLLFYIIVHWISLFFWLLVRQFKDITMFGQQYVPENNAKKMNNLLVAALIWVLCLGLKWLGLDTNLFTMSLCCRNGSLPQWSHWWDEAESQRKTLRCQSQKPGGSGREVNIYAA